jgi:hypothetical protein
MRALKLAALTFMASLALSGLPTISKAQGGSARILQATPSEAAEAPRTTQFIAGGSAFIGVNEKLGLVRTNLYGLLALEKGVKVGSGNGQFAQVGGFAFFRGGSNQIHLTGKYYLNRSLGVQAGYQFGSGESNAFLLHGLYNVSSTTKDPTAKVPWDLQIGLGTLLPNKGPDAFSGFVQLSVGLGHNLTLNTSYWGVFPGGANSINRILAGIGYSF